MGRGNAPTLPALPIKVCCESNWKTWALQANITSLLAIVQPVRDSHNSANGKPLYFDLLVYSNGLFVYNSYPPRQPTLPLFSIKEHFLFFFQTCLLFCYTLLCLIAILCYSQTNPSIAGKNLSVLLLFFLTFIYF